MWWVIGNFFFKKKIYYSETYGELSPRWPTESKTSPTISLLCMHPLINFLKLLWTSWYNEPCLCFLWQTFCFTNFLLNLINFMHECVVYHYWHGYTVCIWICKTLLPYQNIATRVPSKQTCICVCKLLLLSQNHFNIAIILKPLLL